MQTVLSAYVLTGLSQQALAAEPKPDPKPAPRANRSPPDAHGHRDRAGSKPRAVPAYDSAGWMPAHPEFVLVRNNKYPLSPPG
jgi:hypothetical protein